MHLSSRLSFFLLGGVAAVSLVFAVYQATFELHTLRDEVQRQSLVLAESQRHAAERLLLSSSAEELQTHVDQFQNQEQLAGIAFYDATGKPLAITSGMRFVQETPAAVIKSLQTLHVQAEFLSKPDRSLHVLVLPISTQKHCWEPLPSFAESALPGLCCGDRRARA